MNQGKKKSAIKSESNKCQINVSLNTPPALFKLKAIRAKSVLMSLKSLKNDSIRKQIF